MGVHLGWGLVDSALMRDIGEQPPRLKLVPCDTVKPPSF